MTRTLATMHPNDRTIFLAILGYSGALSVAVALMLPDVVRSVISLTS